MGNSTKKNLRNVANLGDFFPQNPFVEVAGPFFGSPSGEISLQKKTLKLPVP
jgi:hypothetical protein